MATVDPQLLPLLSRRFPSVSSGLQKALAEAQAEGKDLSQALQNVAATLGPSEADHLRFIDQLLCSTSYHLNLLSHLLADPDIHRLRDVAIRSCALNADHYPTDILRTLRRRMLGWEPTATICSLLDHATFPERAETVRSAAREIMRRLLDAGVDISKDSVRPYLHDPQYLELAPEPDQPRLIGLLAGLQRLQAVVTDPLDIPRLMQTSLYSAAAISRKSLDQFTTAVAESGIGLGSARPIYYQACRIHRRNERLWVTALQAKAEVPLAAIRSSRAPPPTGGREASSRSDTKINMGNLFPSVMQMADCADCSSVTSPAAYFVSMLQQLDRWRVDPGDKTNLKTLLQSLFARRPDLGDLELSCANTKVLIPYIDLVNEALESVIKRSSLDVEGPFNMGADDTSDGDCTEPQHVDYTVYRDTIQPVVAPLGQFPYNQAIDSIRNCLHALGRTRSELAGALRSEQRLVALAAPSSPTTQTAAAVLDRFAAAESLGLQQEDYVIITGEAIQTRDFLGNPKDYQDRIGLKSAAAYWGYDTKKNMLDESTGLTLVQEQFLPRADITFYQLLALLETSYIGRHLVIEMPDHEAEFSGQLGDMRLRYVETPGAHPAGPLTEDICGRLQAFLRLWKKLPWTIPDLDAAITILSKNSNVITPDVIAGIAGVKQLSTMANVPVAELLPLWGDLPTDGSSTRLFQVATRLEWQHKGVEIAADGDLAHTDHTLSSYAPVLQSALQLTASGFAALTARESNTRLTRETISQLYRISLLCKLLAIEPEQYDAFHALYPTLHPFASPSATIDVMQRFTALTARGWTVESLTFVTQIFHLQRLPDPDLIDEFGVTVENEVSTVVQIITSNTSPGLGMDDGDQKARQALQAKLLTICKILQPLFPDLDAEVLQFMLSEVLTMDGQHPALVTLAQLAPPDISQSPFQGYFLPPSTDMYTFVADQAHSKTSLSIDGVKLDFDHDSGRYVTAPRRLLNGQSYRLSWEGHLDPDLKWQTTALDDAQPFTAALVVDQSAVQTASVLLASLSQVRQLVHNYQLAVEEVHYFHADVPTSIFQGVSMAELEELQRYTDLRDSFPSAKHRSSSSSSPSSSSSLLLDFRKWVANPDDPTQLVTRLARLGSWDPALVKQIRDAHYPGLDDAAVLKVIQQDDLPALQRIRGALTATSRLLAIPALTADLLYSLAAPATQPEDIPTADFSHADALRQAIHSQATAAASLRAANDQLREHQRAALVAYLLQQPFIQDRNLFNADSLYEHFLIDVQMGSGMTTSRLKQAIATVQLYVQRCMLGLEQDYGVQSTAVSRDDWDYMLRYRLWEANRKAFLYPENWIDPTLRDDKSEQFRAFESTVLRTKLTPDSIEDALRAYIYAADEVAHLEPLTYLWERRDVAENQGGVDDNLGGVHLFARTRTSPYRYFYRRVDFRGAYDGYYLFWRPWATLDVGIIPQDVDVDGRKLDRPGTYLIPTVFRRRPTDVDGRLYLFLPHLTLKTVQHSSEDDRKFSAMADDKPSDLKCSHYWELSMGWTELRNGKWTPKQVAQGVMEIHEMTTVDDKEVLPHVGAFRFWTNTRQVPAVFSQEIFNILTVEVETWTGPNTVSDRNIDGCTTVALGRYEMQGPHLVLDRSGSPLYSDEATVPTDFMRLTWQVDGDPDRKKAVVPPQDSVMHDGTSEQLYLAKTDHPRDSTEYRWTLSLDEINWDRPTGLLLETATGDGAQSLLAYPEYLARQHQTYQLPFAEELLSNPVAPALVETATLGSGFADIFQTLSTLPEGYHPNAFGQSGLSKSVRVFHELARSHALYQWETGVHAVSLVMERLQATGQYELALSVARCVFDPTIEGTDLKRCWLFPPFRDDNTTKPPDDTLGSTEQDRLALADWADARANVHAAARGHPIAYMKRLAMKYIEILLDAGDSWFRQNTLEVLPLAMQRYIEASHVFGPAPVPMPALGQRQVLTYNQLVQLDPDENPNPKVDLELDFPFQSDAETRGKSAVVLDAQNTTPFITTGYFCVPANAQILALRQRIDDRLFKIRNNMDLYGNQQHRALFEPPIDPGQLQAALAAGSSPSGFAADLNGEAMPRYRFRALLQQARRLTAELRAMEARIISIRERKDTEALLVLTTGQRQAVQALVLEAKRSQTDEVNTTIAVLQETRRVHETRLGFYLALTGDNKTYKIPDADAPWDEIPQNIDIPSTDDLRLTPNEKLEIESAHTAMLLGQGAASLDTIAAALLVVPQVTIQAEPLGVGISTEVGTGIIARALQATASGIRQGSDYVREEGLVAGRTGQLVRQLQDRRQAANQAGREIKVVDRQIAVQKAIQTRINGEVTALQKEIDNASEVREWLQSKYTNEELYNWLDNQYRSLYQDTYQLAADVAQKLQRAYAFENPRDTNSYLRPAGAGYWDSSRDGLLAGATLGLDLDRIEMAYMNSQPFDFEMEKKISLRQLNPPQLLALRDTGTAIFSLPELLFDLDFPGHYCRRIVSIGVQIPCIAGPFENLNCTLSLTGSSYRITDTATSGEDYPTADGFLTDHSPITAIAVTTGQSDSRQFNLAFQGEKYLPFEGAGAISTWSLELPNPIQQFDYGTIADVVLQLRYTAVRSTRSSFKNAATDAAKALLKSAGDDSPCTLVDISTDYASPWILFRDQLGSGTNLSVSMVLADFNRLLPFWTRGATSKTVQNVSLVFMASDAQGLAGLNDLATALSIQELDSIKSWSSDMTTLRDCLILTADKVNMALPTTWTVQVDNQSQTKYLVKKMWAMVKYTVEYPPIA